MKKEVDLVMFDLDGTLADTGQDLAAAVNFTRARFDLPPLEDTIVRSHVGRGVEHLIRHTLSARSPAQFQETTRVFVEYYEKHLLDRTVLYAGVPQVLDYFQRKRRVVVSNKIQRLTLAVLRGLGVEEQFDAIFGGDSAAEKKPHPALIHLVLQRFQIAPARSVMVGDGDTDVEAGKRAGVITCGVTGGLGNREDLIAAKPDFLIHRLIDLTRYFC
jgi:2-phosphoglycolate phosphatase